MDAIRPFMTSNAPNCGRILKLSHYPPAGNCSLSQFLPGQNSNSFSGETLFRLTDSVRTACLAERLDGNQLAHNLYCAFVETANQNFRLVTAGGLYSLHKCEEI